MVGGGPALCGTWCRYSYYLGYSSPTLCKVGVSVAYLQGGKLEVSGPARWASLSSFHNRWSCVSGHRDSDSEGQHGPTFPAGSDGHEGLGITTLWKLSTQTLSLQILPEWRCLCFRLRWCYGMFLSYWKPFLFEREAYWLNFIFQKLIFFLMAEAMCIY